MVNAKWYGQALKLALQKGIDFINDDIRVMLCTSSYTPDQDAHIYKDAQAMSEVSGAGYTAGGASLGTNVQKSIVYDAATNTLNLDGLDISWTGATITARYAVIYDNTPVSNKPLLGYYDFEADRSVTGGTFSITWSPSGVFGLGVYARPSVAASLSYTMVTVGGTASPAISITPSDSVLTYSSSNPDKVSVNPATGVITGVAIGYSMITLTAERDGYQKVLVQYSVLAIPSGCLFWHDYTRGDAVDLSGNGRNGVINGGALLGATGAVLNGSSGYISVPHESAFNLTSEWTLLAVGSISGTITVGQEFLQKNDETFILHVDNASRLSAAYKNTTTWVGAVGNPLSAETYNKPNFYAGTFKALGSLRSYMNAVPVFAVNNLTTIPVTNTADVTIGRYATRYYSGTIKHAAVFSRELSQSELVEINRYFVYKYSL